MEMTVAFINNEISSNLAPLGNIPARANLALSLERVAALRRAAASVGGAYTHLLRSDASVRANALIMTAERSAALGAAYMVLNAMQSKRRVALKKLP